MMQETEEMEQNTRPSLAPRLGVPVERLRALLGTSSLTLLYSRLLGVMLDLVEEEHSNADTYQTIGGIAKDLLQEINILQSDAMTPQAEPDVQPH